MLTDTQWAVLDANCRARRGRRTLLKMTKGIVSFSPAAQTSEYDHHASRPYKDCLLNLSERRAAP